MDENELQNRMDRIIEWVKTCDTKASIMLTVLSLSVGIFFTSDFVLSSLLKVILTLLSFLIKGVLVFLLFLLC